MPYESELKSVLEAIEEPCLLLREDRTVVHANRSACQEFTMGPVAGRRCYELFFHRNRPCGECPLDRAAVSGRLAQCLRREPVPGGERFIELVNEVRPAQVTLVPDAPDAITSNAGWDTITHRDMLRDIVARFKENGIRVSIFVDADPRMVEAAVATGTDRVELYTEAYATGYKSDPARAIAPFVEAAKTAGDCGLGVNAGHDLSLENLEYFAANIPGLLEVSIGHALISEALYLGLENTVRLYLQKLQNAANGRK